jgi:hypothetical protein
MIHRFKTVSLALAALGLPATLHAQPPELSAPTTLMVLGIDTDETINAPADLRNRWELMAVRSAQGRLAGGVTNEPTVADFGREGDGQPMRDEFPAAQVGRGQQTIIPR